MFGFIGEVLSAPLKIADAGARAAGTLANYACGERGRQAQCGKTIFGEMADEVEEAFEEE